MSGREPIELKLRQLSTTWADLSEATTAREVLEIAAREAMRIIEPTLVLAMARGELTMLSGRGEPERVVNPAELARFYRDRVLLKRPSTAGRFLDPAPEIGMAVPIESRNPSETSMLLVCDRLDGSLDETSEMLLAQIAQVASVALQRLGSIEELERQNVGKEHLMARIAHELRTPLTVIIGWTALLEARHPEAAAIAESIGESAQVARNLIDELSDYSRGSMGALHLESEQVDLSAISSLALADVRPAADRKDLTLVAPSRRGVMITADPRRLRQAIWNLLNNAIRYTPGGGTIRIGIDAGTESVTLSVSDTGMGIDPAFLPEVFEPFRREHPADGKGLGLGLAIVQQIILAHGGSVSAESPGRGEGTTFHLRFPRGAKSE